MIVDKRAAEPTLMVVALLVGPGCGWSGFIATSAAVGAPFTLASGGETLRRTVQGAFVYYEVFFSCASSAVRSFEYSSSAPLNAFM